MTWYQTRLAVLTALAVATMTLYSCGGGDSDEVVYWYVFNGYAGSSQMSLYGPSGTVVTNLGFGQRSEPVSVDRNLGTEFTLVIDGAPQVIELSQPLFSLYPHETGTLFFKKRSDVSDAEVVLYRHVQSGAFPSPHYPQECRLVLGNALSTSTETLGIYDFIPGYETTRTGVHGYDDSILPPAIRRGGLDTEVAAFPFFFFVRDTSADSGLGGKFVWAKGFTDYRAGSHSTFSPTLEYKECVGDPDDEGNYDADSIAECARPQTYGTQSVSPDRLEIYSFHYPNGMFAENCNIKFRVFSDFSNIFEGSHGEGTPVEGAPSFRSGNHYFWVLYGVPARKPLVEEWIGAFVDMPDYPTN